MNGMVPPSTHHTELIGDRQTTMNNSIFRNVRLISPFRSLIESYSNCAWGDPEEFNFVAGTIRFFLFQPDQNHRKYVHNYSEDTERCSTCQRKVHEKKHVFMTVRIKFKRVTRHAWWICVSLLIIIIIIFINCNWVVNRWQWLFYMYTKYEIGY